MLGVARPVRNPADHRDVVGTVHEMSVADALGAARNAAAAAANWAALAPADRAAVLDRAADLMQDRLPTAAPGTPIAALLPHLASSDTDAVPVLESGRIVGIVTRTDLIAALARESLRRDE